MSNVKTQIPLSTVSIGRLCISQFGVGIIRYTISIMFTIIWPLYRDIQARINWENVQLYQPLSDYCYYFCLLHLFIRTTIVTYVIGVEQYEVYFQCDKLYLMVYSVGIVEGFLYFFVSPMALYFGYIHYNVYYRIKNTDTIWQRLEQLVINTNWRQLVQRLVPIRMRKHSLVQAQMIDVLRIVVSPFYVARSKTVTSSHYPELSKRNWSQLAQLWLIVELFNLSLCFMCKQMCSIITH